MCLEKQGHIRASSFKQVRRFPWQVAFAKSDGGLTPARKVKVAFATSDGGLAPARKVTIIYSINAVSLDFKNKEEGTMFATFTKQHKPELTRFRKHAEKEF